MRFEVLAALWNLTPFLSGTYLNVSKESAASSFVVEESALKMEVSRSSETSANIYQNYRASNPRR
jgi:hypothetical protein